ncbi:MAG: cohesin domain-containing protein [Pyrinomonadaceae bacterium]
MTRIKKTLKTVFGLAGMYLLLSVIGAQAAALTITATTDDGVGVPGAIVDLTDMSGGIRTGHADAFGYYQFEDIKVGETYILEVRHKGYEFTTQVVGITEDLTKLNFPALQFSTGSRESITDTEANPVTVSLPTQGISCKASTVIVPVSVGDLTGKNVLAFDFEVRFNPAVLRPSGFAPTSNDGTLSSDFVITANPFLPGRLIVSGFGIYPLSGAGTLLNLNFEVLGQPGAASPLTWQAFMFNEGDPASTTTDGLLTVRNLVRVPRDRQSLVSFQKN